jgi:hypothetical protein
LSSTLRIGNDVIPKRQYRMRSVQVPPSLGNIWKKYKADLAPTLLTILINGEGVKSLKSMDAKQ